MNLKVGEYKLPKLEHNRKEMARSTKKKKKKGIFKSCGTITSGLTYV